MRRTYTFVWWDVFTTRPLAGNQLLIFTDARGLSSARMQTLAREAGLSETAFVLPRSPATEGRCGVRVRIFTPREELRFAGHPTLGTALFLRASRRTGVGPPKAIVLELPIGPIPVAFNPAHKGQVFGEMRQNDPMFGSLHAREVVAPLLGLKSRDLATEPPIQSVSTGLPYVIVPVRSLSALRSVRIDWPRALKYLGKGKPGPIFYCMTSDVENPKARMQARCIDVENEDSATGSAAGCAVAWMVKHRLVSPEVLVLIEQGREIGRPSQIYARAAVNAGRVTDVRVGGYAVEVMRGEYRF
jgi:trans-2,3-dihydro-3-hydroxyanthranilate isomerase